MSLGDFKIFLILVYNPASWFDFQFQLVNSVFHIHISLIHLGVCFSISTRRTHDQSESEDRAI